MNKFFKTKMFASALIAAGALAACGGGGSEPFIVPAPTPLPTPVPAAPQVIALTFAAVAGADPVNCGSTNIAGLGTGKVGGALKDLRFYIANVKLVTAAGAEVPLALGANDDWNATLGSDRVTLIDLEDKTGACAGTVAMNSVVKGTVPAGDYVGVKLAMGVPFAMNHTDQGAGLEVTPAAINNAVNPGMAWSWAGGRKFAKIEVTDPLAASPSGTAGKWSAPTFNMHLGSTNCTGTNPAAGQVDRCSEPNRMEFGFAAFNPASQKIVVDIRALLKDNDVTTNVASAPGCMSGLTDPECTGVFTALQIGFNGQAPVGASYTVGKVGDASNYGLPINGGAAQTVFKVVAK